MFTQFLNFCFLLRDKFKILFLNTGVRSSKHALKCQVTFHLTYKNTLLFHPSSIFFPVRQKLAMCYTIRTVMQILIFLSKEFTTVPKLFSFLFNSQPCDFSSCKSFWNGSVIFSVNASKELVAQFKNEIFI